jgi:hypothetical protein
VKSIEDVPDEVAQLFLENEIKGSELLALDRDGLKDKRVGTICILLDKISALKREASQGVVTLIEHSPYCFGKILDYLRLKHFSAMGLARDPASPTVCDDQGKMLEMVVRYYFPGDSSKLIILTHLSSASAAGLRLFI